MIYLKNGYKRVTVSKCFWENMKLLSMIFGFAFVLKLSMFQNNQAPHFSREKLDVWRSRYSYRLWIERNQCAAAIMFS